MKWTGAHVLNDTVSMEEKIRATARGGSGVICLRHRRRTGQGSGYRIVFEKDGPELLGTVFEEPGAVRDYLLIQDEPGQHFFIKSLFVSVKRDGDDLEHGAHGLS